MNKQTNIVIRLFAVKTNKPNNNQTTDQTEDYDQPTKQTNYRPTVKTKQRTDRTDKRRIDWPTKQTTEPTEWIMDEPFERTKGRTEIQTRLFCLPGSVRTSFAAAISMNIFSAFFLSSPLYWSGCHLTASLRYDFKISFFDAVLKPHRTEKDSPDAVIVFITSSQSGILPTMYIRIDFTFSILGSCNSPVSWIV